MIQEHYKRLPVPLNHTCITTTKFTYPLLLTFNLIFVIFHDFMQTHHEVTHQRRAVFLELTTETQHELICRN